MSIKLYCGIMGSGKTYEVVSEVILGSLRRGRRVISNIAGLNYEVMCSLLSEEGLSRNLIGELVCVSHDQVKDPLFWRTDTDDQTGRQPFIAKGDVVCLDENWRFWNGYSARDDDGNKLPPEVKNFFRMHRQFPDPVTGFTCEIALISQDVSDFSRFVRGVVEQIFVMSKLTQLGLDSRYRVDIYQRKITRVPLRSIQRSYDAKYFGCYKSHSQGDEGGAKVVESSADNRGNILHGPLLKVGVPLAILLIIGGVYGISRFLHPKKPDQQNDAKKNVPAAAAPAVSSVRPAAPVSAEWRVLGWSRIGKVVTVTLINSSKQLRILSNPDCKISASGLEVELRLPEGGFAVPWTSFDAARKAAPL